MANKQASPGQAAIALAPAALLGELRSLIDQTRQHAAQMANSTLTMLYLRWLDKYDRAVGEEAPIGLILYASANAEQVELMDLDSANIRVAEYLDHFPDMKLLQAQLHRSALLARERAALRTLPHVDDPERGKE